MTKAITGADMDANVAAMCSGTYDVTQALNLYAELY